MTTGLTDAFLTAWNPVWTEDLRNFLLGVATDSSLLEPRQLRERLDALEALERRLVGLGNNPGARIYDHAQTIRTRLEAVNAALYESIYSEIVRGAPPHTLLQWIQASPQIDDTVSGLGYDYRDEVVNGVFQLREPGEPRLHPLPEMVFYQPTPVRHILRLILVSALSEKDVFVDLGSGLGHVVLLVSLLTGVRSFGIEVEPAYVASAQECARRLSLHRALFFCGDARSADLSSATVFYLYSPFVGSILADVLGRLKNECTDRQIKICALGPCTQSLAMQSWLKPMTPSDPQQISVFQTLL